MSVKQAAMRARESMSCKWNVWDSCKVYKSWNL